MLVNIVSFIKSLLIAAYYGTSGEFDVYVLSLTPVRLLMGVLLVAIQTALIPKYVELTVKKNDRYAFSAFGTFTLWILFFAIILMLFFGISSPAIAKYLGSGFDTQQLQLMTLLLRVSTGFFLVNLFNQMGLCLFDAHRQFLLPAFIPLISSAGSVIYLIYFYEYGVSSLMYGLFWAMLIQASFVLWSARRFFPENIRPLSLFHSDVLAMFHSLSFLLIGATFGHVNVLIDQMMASRLPSGSIAALHYATKLHTLLTQLFIIVVSRAVLPFFTQQIAHNDIEGVKATFFLTLKRVLYVLFPLSLGIIFVGHPLVRIVFQRGEFSSHSTAATAGAWIAYTIGLPIQAVGFLAAKVFNALQENKILMYVSGMSMGLNVVFNLIFMRLWGHIGIAYSTSLVYVIATIVLLVLLQKKIGRFWPQTNKRTA